MEDIAVWIEEVFGSLGAAQLYIFLLTIGLAIFSSVFFKGRLAKGKSIPNSSGINGFQAATKMLYQNGITDVTVVANKRMIGDCYNPKTKTIHLSKDIYHGTSVAALAVACHEVGHAVQFAKSYKPIAFRNAILPAVQISNSLIWIVIIGGIFLQMTGLLWVGIAAFGVMAFFQLVTLPIEFNASTRAKEFIQDSRLANGSDLAVAKKVLSAAALTYVIAFFTTILTMIRFLLIIMDNNRS